MLLENESVDSSPFVIHSAERGQQKVVPTFLQDILNGLEQEQKSVPPKYFYDDIGMRLFNAICDQPEYYLTRVEADILPQVAQSVAQKAQGKVGIMEIGVGSRDKVRPFLQAIEQLAWYSAVEINRNALQTTFAKLGQQFPKLRLEGVCADFTQGWDIPTSLADDCDKVIGFFPGSTIGNFDPQMAEKLLRNFRQCCGPDCWFVVGVDLEKSESTLLKAYDDQAKVTAAFNLNLLVRLQHELGADLDMSGFLHEARYNAELRRIEMHLISRGEQVIKLGKHGKFTLADGESIHTENSWKYSQAAFKTLAEKSGFYVDHCFVDSKSLFAVYLLKAGDTTAQPSQM